MATRERQPDDGKETQAQMPSDGDIFADPFANEAAYNEIFSSLADFSSEAGFVQPPRRRRASSRVSRTPPHPGRFSNVQKILVISIIGLAAALTYVLAGKIKPVTLPKPQVDPPIATTDVHEPPQHAATRVPVQTPAIPHEQPSLGHARKPNLPSPEPFSLELANRLYVRRDFEHARLTYERLYERLPVTEDNQAIRDFLLLRIALCNKNGDDVAQADTLFRTVSLSRLPILRALARYCQSTTLMERNRYLEAATRAYQTIALVGVIDYDMKWASAVQQQCWFLVAEAMTRNVLSLCDADSDLPPALWGQQPDIDPFLEMDEPQLRIFLASGTEVLDQAVLSPQIRDVSGNDGPVRWSVICNGASIEELLSRFSANAGLNIQWADDGQVAFAEDSLRRRPVYLYTASAAAQQITATAAGSVGLLARMDGRGNIDVLNPMSYSSLADHTTVLADESVSLWQRFLLTSEDDDRVPNAHFALGLLKTTRGQLDEAIGEYKLVANRFPKHAISPHALLHSGKLKVRLRDYVGAHTDLRQLVELYPETDLADRACLHLAEATMKAGLYGEATDLYRKVHDLGLSIESQTKSALGAGRCFYEMGDYAEATTWLNRYVTLARDQRQPEFYAACLLLGKSYLALHKPQQAHTALNLALKGDLSRQQHVETVAVLVKTYIEQELYIEALHTLESTGGWQLSQQEMIELLLLRTRVLRSIGLMEKAIALLDEKGQFLSSPELKCKVAIELAKCYTETGDHKSARETLSRAFPLVGTGDLAQQIGYELASVCMQLGQPAQAASVCSQLLAQASPTYREPILGVLADAYREQGRYDLAVATTLDRFDDASDPNGLESSSSAIVIQ